MSPWPEPMYGQCACGASLTVDHVRNHCPLRPQQANVNELAELWWDEFTRRWQARFDVSHVAVLGEN